MKKQSVMVKQVLMSIITAGMFTFGFSACSDELDNEARDMAAPQSECLQFTNLEQYSHSVPVEVSAKGDWTIDLQFEDEDHQFCYVYPRQGHGPATVKLYMLDNWTETRNNGTMTISDLGNPNNNKVIALQQKCNLDNRQYGFTRGEEAINGTGKRGTYASTPQGFKRLFEDYGTHLIVKTDSSILDSDEKHYYDLQKHAQGSHHMEYNTSDNQHIRIKDDRFDICNEKDHWAMQIRLVMDL